MSWRLRYNINFITFCFMAFFLMLQMFKIGVCFETTYSNHIFIFTNRHSAGDGVSLTPSRDHFLGTNLHWIEGSRSTFQIRVDRETKPWPPVPQASNVVANAHPGSQHIIYRMLIASLAKGSKRGSQVHAYKYSRGFVLQPGLSCRTLQLVDLHRR